MKCKKCEVKSNYIDWILLYKNDRGEGIKCPNCGAVCFTHEVMKSVGTGYSFTREKTGRQKTMWTYKGFIIRD